MAQLMATKLALITAATVAATIALPTTAQALESRQTLESPSGNIRCVLDVEPDGAPLALCQIRDYSYSVPAGLARDDTSGEPCSGTQQGDFRLDAGQPGFIRCSYAALGGGYGTWPTLDYGQSQSIGTITCDSRTTGITCTDTASGHFFRISRQSYELG